MHGGITETDITNFVTNAEDEAKINQQCELDTVVFFDEANTTDAIGLIKEIMCDPQRSYTNVVSRKTNTGARKAHNYRKLLGGERGAGFDTESSAPGESTVSTNKCGSSQDLGYTQE